MSSIVSATTVYPTKAESNFIRFCKEVSNEKVNYSNYWSKNLDLFERVFLKFKNFGKSWIPISKFLERNREVLEKKAIDGYETNEEWITIGKDEVYHEYKSGISIIKPRGIFLPMKDEDDWSHSIPLSEIYLSCIEISESNEKTLGGGVRKSFSGVTIDTLPAKFLHLFYCMLSEIEPDNEFFKDNVEICEEMVTPASNILDGIGLSGDNGLGKIMSNLMESEGAKNIRDMLQQAIGSIDPNIERDTTEAFHKGMETMDFSGVMENIQKIPAINNIIKSLTSCVPTGANISEDPSTTPSHVYSITEDPSIELSEQD